MEPAVGAGEVIRLLNWVGLDWIGIGRSSSGSRAEHCYILDPIESRDSLFSSSHPVLEFACLSPCVAMNDVTSMCKSTRSANLPNEMRCLEMSVL